MTETKDLLQDEEFLKIRRLNSAEPNKRHSVTYDNVILPQESMEVSPRSSTTSLVEPVESSEAERVAGKQEQEEEYPVDAHMQKYLSHLKSKSRSRFHRKDASKYVSFLGT